MATGTPSEELVERAHDLITRVGLEHRLSHRPAELSGGERERAAGARSLLHRPLLLLADEPTGNLDRTNAQQVAQLLLEIQQQEQTMLVVVTHNNELADQLQKQTTLDNGQLRCS